MDLISKESIFSNVCPSRYVRYINNRLILEDSEIRAAAVSILGKFSLKYENLTKNIYNILE